MGDRKMKSTLKNSGNTSREFPSGMRVLVVDGNQEILHQLETMLKQCNYGEALPNNILRCMKEKGVKGLTRDQVASHRQKYQDKLRRINDAPLNTTPSNHLYLSTQQQRALAAGSISLGPNTGTQDCDIILEDVVASGDYSSLWNEEFPSVQQRALAAGSISLGPNTGTQNFQNIPSMSNVNTSLASPSQDCDIILEDVLAYGDYSSAWNEEFPRW